MRAVLIAALTLWLGMARADDQLDAMLRRVSEEAEVFRAMAPKVIGRETLHQRARKNPRRFRLRVGADALKPPKPKFKEREIVSEYAFSTLTEAPEALLELRQIVSVDGRPVTDSGKARETLTIGLRNNDNRAKKKMLKRFEKLGLKGAATDFGQVILLFRRASLKHFEFSSGGTNQLGADQVTVLRFHQREGPEAFTIFQGRKAIQSRLEGEIWVRTQGFIPLKVVMRTRLVDGEHEMLHEGTVDYKQSAYGVLLPVSVQYRQLVEGELLVENIASYTDYRMFAVEATISFTAEEEPSRQEPAASKNKQPR